MDNKSARQRRVVVIGTGGTIAGRASSALDNIGYSAAEVGVAELVEDLAPDGVTLLTEQVAQLDSKDMDFGVWQSLADRCAEWLALPDIDGIVVTHGTDTIEETAYFLQRVLAPEKPVVLTCAMRPTTALAPDGPQNMRDAVCIASGTPDPSACGVSVVCAGRVHSALDVQKVHTYRLDAFDSGDAGPIGHMEEGALRRVREWPGGDPAGAAQSLERVRALPADCWPRVEIVASHAGATGRTIDALCANATAGDALDGLVIAATGNGSIHRSIEAAALRAREAGVAVVRATKCAQGRILPIAHATLRDAGNLSPVKARISLMLELMGPNAHASR
ncbi:asparaginase [Variovorax sp. RHLX14]|uniref:asparaginase n=1 Tax=Variovorax sp. RHLX14 TaxID=1259731 RepID=UPI003F4489EC